MTGEAPSPRDHVRARLEAILNECSVHRRRLTFAHDRCRPLVPLDAESYTCLSDEQVGMFDQLVYRFTKLQDTIGAKLYPLLAAQLREDSATLTVYDVLNELERFSVVADANRWMELREIRNQLAHTYENRPDEGASYLNRVYDAADELLDAANRAQQFAQERILSSLGDDGAHR